MVLTLGRLIEILEEDEENRERIVPLGFGKPHSYRGYYDNLAFKPLRNVTVGSMLEAAREALGATYQGWKGGDFKMDSFTECWLAFLGETSANPMSELLIRYMLGQQPACPIGE